jgi:small subunit ribosomal protein S23
MSKRFQPSAVHRVVEQSLRVKLLQQPPAWLNAVRRHPPGPSLVRQQDTSFMHHSHQNNDTVRSRHASKFTRFKPPRPSAIVYPEDRLRRRFFKDHPLETLHARNLIEPFGSIGWRTDDFSTLVPPDGNKDRVTGEE